MTTESRVGRSCVAGRHRLCRIQVGTDMVSVSDVSDSLNRFGKRYVQRLFTADEAAYCRAATGQCGRRAVRRSVRGQGGGLQGAAA